MRHTLVTMTRGDAGKIAEWVGHHAALGFDDFQVVLDGDIDGSEDVVRSLDVPAEVSVHRRDEVGEYLRVRTVAERQEWVGAWRAEHAEELASGRMRGASPVSWRQQRHLPDVLAPYAAGERGRGWLGLLDVDEFVVVPGSGSVATITAESDKPRLRLLNFDVDTRGHDPSRPVREQHTRRWSRADLLAHPDQRWARRVKSLVRYRCARLDHTVHKISRGPFALLEPEVARIHHFRMPPHGDAVGIPYSVDDPLN